MAKKEIVVATSGYFQPLHAGHLQLFRDSKKLGDKLIVIINSDRQSVMKHGFSFMSEKDRAELVKELKCVDDVFISIDTDRTQCKTLEMLKPDIFTKGGDRTSDEIPEKEVCDRLGIKIIDGVGGSTKVQSSSELIRKAFQQQK
jgi:D-beta-D-heptose 7-phosphate kinase/D-beta-D-heptose 1-phosphate adenosyltransferase